MPAIQMYDQSAVIRSKSYDHNSVTRYDDNSTRNIEVDTSLPAERVVRLLEQLKDSHPLPRQIRVDNGPELVSAKLVAWCEQHDIRLHHIQPGRPMQNGYVERFNRSFRNEVLDAHVFASLSEVREHVHQWLISYNEERPHESLGNIPPALFRQQQTNRKNAPEFSI